MAEITSYPTAQPKSGDYLLGAQVGVPGDNPANPTKKFTVGSVSGTPNNNGQLFNTVGMKVSWNNGDSNYRVASSRAGASYAGLIYSKLYIEFENLELEAGSTYGLLMERFKQRRIATAVGIQSPRPAGFKRMSNNGVSAPFNQRVFELPITTTTGQFFDFKFDLYYTEPGGGANPGFPAISGMSAKMPSSGPRNSTTQYLAFRIVKRTNGVEQISPHIIKLRMIGVAPDVPAGLVPKITFGPY